jgi:formate dehydrogenase subunit gamma
MRDDDENAERAIGEFLADHEASQDQLLPLLHRIMKDCGCVSESAMRLVAQALNVSAAEVYGVVSFYDDFDALPLANDVDVCGGEACLAVGGGRLYAALSTAAAGQQIGVRRVFCLGNCAAGPSARIGDEVIGRATLDQLLNR